ncbi:MAG: PAS domain-containing protein [Deltaproteobacteria bacterium]|nr:PAS domain-containing protein [Deltaproteobacteria bacterium]
MGGGNPADRSGTQQSSAFHMRFSVTQLLVLAVLFVIVPLAFSNYWGYTQSRSYLTEAAFRNIRNVAALEASETLGVVRSAERLVPTIVRANQHLINSMRAWAAVEDKAGREVLSNVLYEHLGAKAVEGDSVDEFYVLSPEGVLAGSSRRQRRAGVDLSGTECFKQGHRMSGIIGFDFQELGMPPRPAAVGSPIPGDDDPEEGVREPRLVVASPINDSRGAFLGVFCATFDLEIQRRLLLSHRHRTKLATLYLIDDQERIVAGSFDDQETRSIGEHYSFLKRTSMSERTAWEGRFDGGSGNELLVAYAPIPVFDWAIVVEVPVVYALADLVRLKWQAILGSSILCGVLLGCVVLVWRMLVLPLRALSQTSETMATGAAGNTVQPSGPTELVELAGAFNRMSLGLKDSTDLLEARIDERTRELRDNQTFLELLLDSIDRRVIVINSDQRIVKINAAATRMHGPGLIGEYCCTALEGAPGPLTDCPVRKTLETGESVAQERSQRTVRGIEPVFVETYPILNEQGEVASVVEIGRVVTAEMQLQQHIVHQEKMAAFGQLAAGVAHEIGNPIASIQSQLQLAQDEPEYAEHTLDVVQQQVGRMDRILRRLVEFTRSRKDEIVVASVNEIVREVAFLVEHHPLARSVTIEFELGENLNAVRVNEDHLVQVLLNLSLNSLDAIEGVGTLTFETTEEAGHVAIRVKDSGCGIAQVDCQHVFEPFFSKKRKTQGTGLGLFVSKGTLEEMGGKLELESSDSDGTVFVVRVIAA